MFSELKKSIHDFVKSVIFHTPKDKLNEWEIKQIKQNGLIHFCNKKNVDNIIKEGVKGGLKAPMMKSEENFTWYYINIKENFEINKNNVLNKGVREEYDMYVIIKQLTDEQINRLRIRREFDGAVIYPGTLKTYDMTAGYIEM